MSMSKEEVEREWERLRAGQLRRGAEEASGESDDEYLDAHDGSEDAERGFSKPFKRKPRASASMSAGSSGSASASATAEQQRRKLDDAVSASEAAAHKVRGNELYRAGEYAAAGAAYARAASSAHASGGERATYLANLAQACLAQGDNAGAERAASECLSLDGSYRKARERRRRAREALGDYRGALADAEALGAGAGECGELRRKAEAKEQAEGDKAMRDLKELADGFLSNFGLSTRDFAAQKDPRTGSYSISMRKS